MIFQILVWWTLGLTVAIVLALAGYLVPVAYFLYRTGGSKRSHLGEIISRLNSTGIRK